MKALFDSLMAELRLSGKDRNKSITTKAAKELIAIKEKTLESQQKQTKLLKELEFTTREAEKLTRRIMDDEDERKEEGNELLQTSDSMLKHMLLPDTVDEL